MHSAPLDHSQLDGAKAPELSWWHLNFRQPALELKFRRFYSRKKLQIFRIALPCLLVVTGLLAIADPYLLNDCGDCVEQYRCICMMLDILSQIWFQHRIIRLAIQIPLCVIAFCTSFTSQLLVVWYFEVHLVCSQHGIEVTTNLPTRLSRSPMGQ